MNVRTLFIVAVIISLFLQTTLVSLPLVFILAFTMFVFYPDSKSLIVGFFAGVVLDILKLNVIGLTPIIIIGSFLLIQIIRKLAELKDYRVVLFLLFAASYIYASTFSYSNNIFWFAGIYLTIGLIIFYFQNKISL